MKSHLLFAVIACVVTLLTGTTRAAVQPLEGRLPSATPDGIDYQAYYDPNLDITWAANANMNGADSWDNQSAWVAGLTIGTVSGWRLPSADVNGDGTLVNCQGGGVVGCEDNEMGFLYWEEGITPASPGPFTNLVSSIYWAGTEIGISQDAAMVFFFNGGIQSFWAKWTCCFFAWPVRSGDVGAIADTDGDGLVDNADNCILQPNGPLHPDAGSNSQLDSDSDGYGNLCDPDFDNNLTVDFADLAFMKSVFFSTDPVADLDGDGKVDFADLAIMKSMFFGPPGPSGLAP